MARVPAVATRIFAVQAAAGLSRINRQIIHRDAVNAYALAVFDFDQFFDGGFAETRIVQPVDIGMQERILGRITHIILVPARVNDDLGPVDDLVGDLFDIGGKDGCTRGFAEISYVWIRRRFATVLGEFLRHPIGNIDIDDRPDNIAQRLLLHLPLVRIFRFIVVQVVVYRIKMRSVMLVEMKPRPLKEPLPGFERVFEFAGRLKP